MFFTNCKKLVEATLFAFFTFCMALQFLLSANAEVPLSQSIEVDSELSHSVIKTLAQDEQGFIWVGTAAGLNRFDGYESKRFFNRTHGLSDDEINALVLDASNNLWIGTENGLNIYWRDTGKFESFFNNPADDSTLISDRILSLASLRNGKVWIGTDNGVSLYEPQNKTFKNIRLIDELGIDISNQEISSIVPTESQTLIGTTSGDLGWLTDKGLFELINPDNTLDYIHQILPLTKTEFFILSSGSIYRLDTQSKEVISVELEDIGLDNEFIDINYLSLDVKNRLLVGTVKNGLFRCVQETKECEQVFFQDNKSGYSGANKVNSLLQDKTNVIWIGTNGNLHKINPNLIKFNHLSTHKKSELVLNGNSTFSVLIDSDGWHWFGSEYDGLTVYKPTSQGLMLAETIKLPRVDPGAINSIVAAGNNTVWVVTTDSLWEFNRSKETFSLVRNPKWEDATLYIGKYYQGNLWIGSDYGLWRLDQTGKIKQYLVNQQIYNLKNKISAIDFDDTKNAIWVATESGVLHFDIASETFTDLEQLVKDLPSSLSTVIYDLELDLHGLLWIATYQHGLYKIDFSKQKIKAFNRNNSMLNNLIYSIQMDEQNNLWLATAQGLFRLEPKTEALAHFGLAQGQPIRDFNLGAKTISDKGEILLGGINGVIQFNPQAFEKDNFIATPVITGIKINGQELKVGTEDGSHSEQPVSVAEKITMHHDDTSISIAFSGTHYADPEDNRYRYILEGYDKDWMEVDAKGRRAIYGKLDTGDYTFKLRASNKDSVWSPNERILKIRVLPSPYFSSTALLIYALIFSGLLFFGYFLYRDRINERKAAQKKLAESEERLKLSLWGSGDELWDWNIKTGALHLSNEWDIDFPRDGIRSGHSDANSNIHPNDLPFVRQALQAHLSGKSGHFESTYRLSDGDGGWIWVLDQGKSVVFENERPSRMAGTIKNVSEIKDAEQQLSVIAKSFENISDGVWILDSNLKYIAINKAFESITGYTEEDVIGAPMQENAIKDMNDNFYRRLMALLEEKGSWQGELEAIRHDGTVYPIDINIDVVRDADNNVINYVGVFSDITYRKIAEKELRRLATTDQLTSLPNRNTFRSEIESILNHSSAGALHALLFIDLDNFKRINDSLGHSAGDELLVKVAEHLQAVVQETNGMVARLGGDEFIIFLENVDAWNQAAQVAQEVLDRFSEKLELSVNKIMVSPSIGIVMYPENGNTPDELLRNADTAMYYAKKKGKNTFQFYTRQMNEQAKLRLNLENDLRAAIEKDEFVVFYQPKVGLKSGKIEGFEALVRWRSEKRGLIMPNEFIPLAEETGLIIPISQQVIEKACIQVRDWQKRNLFNGKMAINLSAVQFYHENLWETVKNALHLANLDAESIEFEITEGMVMQDLAHSIQQMNTLKEMGVSLALDDFGVGYSSLGNLKDFPIDTLKIDRSFVWDLDDSDRDKKLVSSIVTLAHNLDIRVVAEGVETIKQTEALMEMNCEEIQGFIFSRPLPAFEVERLLEDSNATLERALIEAREDEQSH